MLDSIFEMDQRTDVKKHEKFSHETISAARLSRRYMDDLERRWAVAVAETNAEKVADARDIRTR